MRWTHPGAIVGLLATSAVVAWLTCRCDEPPPALREGIRFGAGSQDDPTPSPAGASLEEAPLVSAVAAPAAAAPAAPVQRGPLRVTARVTLSQGEPGRAPEVVSRLEVVYRLDVLEVRGERVTARVSLERERTLIQEAGAPAEVREGQPRVETVTCRADELLLLRAPEQVQLLAFLPAQGELTPGLDWTRAGTLRIGRLPLEMHQRARSYAVAEGVEVDLRQAGRHLFEELGVTLAASGRGRALFDPARPGFPRELSQRLSWTASGGEGADAQATVELELSCQPLESDA